MYKFCLLIFTAVSCCASEASLNSPTSLPPGVKFPVALREELDVRHVHVGDSVRFEMTNNLLGPQRAVVIPKGAHMTATITEVSVRKRANDESRLTFMIVSADWKGHSFPLHAVLDKVIKLTVPNEQPAGGRSFTTVVTVPGNAPLAPPQSDAPITSPRADQSEGIEQKKSDPDGPMVLVSHDHDLRFLPDRSSKFVRHPNNAV